MAAANRGLTLLELLVSLSLLLSLSSLGLSLLADWRRSMQLQTASQQLRSHLEELRHQVQRLDLVGRLRLDPPQQRYQIQIGNLQQTHLLPAGVVMRIVTGQNTLVFWPPLGERLVDATVVSLSVAGHSRQICLGVVAVTGQITQRSQQQC